MAATGAMEAQLKKTSGVLYNLSDQQIIDCVKGRGCQGGYADSAFSYWVNYGTETDADYPFMAKVDSF